MVEYRVRDNDDGAIHVLLNNFTLVKVYYESERVRTPVSREKAYELANTIKCMVKSEYPTSEIDEDDYQPSGFSKFLESIGEDGRDALAELFAEAIMSDMEIKD